MSPDFVEQRRVGCDGNGLISDCQRLRKVMCQDKLKGQASNSAHTDTQIRLPFSIALVGGSKALSDGKALAIGGKCSGKISLSLQRSATFNQVHREVLLPGAVAWVLRDKGADALDAFAIGAKGRREIVL